MSDEELRASEAAVKVQAAQRGKQGRSKVAQIRGTTGTSDESHDLEAAAIKVQAVQRGRGGRLVAANLADEELRASEAAVKVQAAQRGKQGRSKVAQIRGTTGTSDESHDLEAAAIKVQAAQRGRGGRLKAAHVAAAEDGAEAPDTARIDYAIPTHEMRTALADESVELPSGEALTELSRVYNENLERVRRMEKKTGFSWFSLFQELDEDGACRSDATACSTAA